MTLVLVCGSRGWTDAAAIERRLRELPAGTTIIHGRARTGADALADRIARRLRFRVETYPADWKRFGLGAGPIRNRVMLGLDPSVVLAFWDGISTGTADCIDEARRRGIPVEVFDP